MKTSSLSNHAATEMRDIEQGDAVVDAGAGTASFRSRRAYVRHGAISLWLSTVLFVLAYASFDTAGFKLGWALGLFAVGTIFLLRMLINKAGKVSNSPTDILLLIVFGGLYGLAPLLLGPEASVFHITLMNFWLSGVCFSVLLWQGVTCRSGLSFVIPAMTPMLYVLLTMPSSEGIIFCLCDLLLLGIVYTTIYRTRRVILDEAGRRVAFEQLAERYDLQRQRSEALVDELMAENERRRRAEIELRDARDAAEAMSRLDPLTRLNHRRAFDEILKEQWDRHRASNSPLSLIVADVDAFRSYCDHFGNSAGDQSLVLIAETIANSVAQDTNITARYSVERFAVLLKDTGEGRALDIADAMCANVHNLTLMHPGATIDRVMTISCGVASLDHVDQMTSFGELIDAVDQALRRAQRSGGNCVYSIGASLAEQDTE